MMVPRVDHDLCIGCGNCEIICPDVFEVGLDGFSHILPGADCSISDCCEEAAEECPVNAIILEDE